VSWILRKKLREWEKDGVGEWRVLGCWIFGPYCRITGRLFVVLAECNFSLSFSLIFVTACLWLPNSCIYVLCPRLTWLCLVTAVGLDYVTCTSN
jgi:hypothetical protein